MDAEYVIGFSHEKSFARGTRPATSMSRVRRNQQRRCSPLLASSLRDSFESGREWETPRKQSTKLLLTLAGGPGIGWNFGGDSDLESRIFSTNFWTACFSTMNGFARESWPLLLQKPLLDAGETVATFFKNSFWSGQLPGQSYQMCILYPVCCWDPS